MLGVAVCGLQGGHALVGQVQRGHASFVVFVERLFGGFQLCQLACRRILLRDCDFGAFGGGRDGRGEALRLGVDRLRTRPQVVHLPFEARQTLATVGDGPDSREVSRLRGLRNRLAFAEHLAGALELFGGDLDTLGQLGFEFGGLEGLLVELLRVGPGRLARRLAEVPAAFGGHPAGRVDALGERRQPEPGAVGRGRGGRDLGEMLFVFGHFRVRTVEFGGHLVLPTPDLVLDGGVFGHLGAAGDEVVGGQAQPCVAEIGLDGLGPAGDLGLASQWFELTTEFGRQIVQTRQVGLHRVELADRFFLALAVFEDPGRLFDERAAVLGPGLEDRRQPSLADDHVHLATDTGVRQQLLHVHEATGTAVDLVLAGAVAEHPARDGHLGVLDRQRTVGVVDGEGDLGAAQRRTARGAGEDDVLHLPAAQRFRSLLAHHPGQGVDDVRLTGAVGTDDARDTRLEAQGRRRGERLEALQGQAFEVHDGTDYSPSRRVSALLTVRRSRRGPRAVHPHARPPGPPVRAWFPTGARRAGRGPCPVAPRQRPAPGRRPGSTRSRRARVREHALWSTTGSPRPARARGRAR